MVKIEEKTKIISEGEFKKRIRIWLGGSIQEGILDSEKYYKIVEEAKKELVEILSADMPYFQKLLAISAFKNKWFGEK